MPSILQKHTMQHQHSVLTMLATCLWITKIVIGEHDEICVGKDFVAECEVNEVILVQTATFGRMKIGKCVRNDFGYIGCMNDVLGLVDRWCSGLHQCTFEVSNDDLDKANKACATDLMSYLDIDYTCIPVSKEARCSSKMTIRSTEGYISSYVASQTECGSTKAPWIIEAHPGQIIHLWLIDFGALDRQHQSLYTSCHQLYGFIIERDLGVNLTMCGGTERKTEIYKSKTNKVEIHLLASQKDTPRYLIQHTFIGCPDLSPPAYAWYKREGNEAVIGCKSNDRVWRLYCNGNTWNGVVGNCSETDLPGSGSTVQFGFTFSTVIILTCVVCAAILLIIVVVVGGFVYVKKQKIKHELKLRSDYSMLIPSQYSTFKGGYCANTVNQLLADGQPLVHIVDKVAMDTMPSHSDSACATMSTPVPANNETMKKVINTTHANLI